MKKGTLLYGIALTVSGLIFLSLALVFEFKFEGYLRGFGGAGLASGIMSIWKYMYWTKPENVEKYKDRLKNEKIELRDERKVMLRDKSARITYFFMLGIYVALIIIFSILNTLGYWVPFSRYLVIIFSIIMVVQLIIIITAFSCLDKRL